MRGPDGARKCIDNRSRSCFNAPVWFLLVRGGIGRPSTSPTGSPASPADWPADGGAIDLVPAPRSPHELDHRAVAHQRFGAHRTAGAQCRSAPAAASPPRRWPPQSAPDVRQASKKNLYFGHFELNAWTYVGAGCCLLQSALKSGRCRADMTFYGRFLPSGPHRVGGAVRRPRAAGRRGRRRRSPDRAQRHHVGASAHTRVALCNPFGCTLHGG